MLDEAAACCPDCTATVEAIRQCRGCSSAEDDATSDTGTDNGSSNTEIVGEDDNEDDPSKPLKPCSDQLSAVTTCYAANKCEADPKCDAYDPDVDKTCVEEADITDDFQSCCSACADEAQAVLSCRCPYTTDSAGDIDTSNAASFHVGIAAVAFGLTLVHSHLW